MAAKERALLASGVSASLTVAEAVLGPSLPPSLRPVPLSSALRAARLHEAAKHTHTHRVNVTHS